MSNGRLYFYGALYQTTGRFSHVARFLAKFLDRFDALPFEREAVLQMVKKIRADFLHFQGKIDDKIALHLLMAEDLKRIQEVLESDEAAQKIEAELPLEEKLLICRDEGVQLLRNIGVTITPPEVFIVDSIPPPYNKTDVSAITADEDDYQKHGIKPGLYFLRSRVRPVYSRYLLLHEMIHTVFGLKSPLLFGRGLEEGVAEIVGAFYLSPKILDKQLTINLFTYNRLNYGHNQFWDLYLDYTRQAAFLYQQFGMDGLVTLLNNGRELVKDVEDKCLRNSLKSIDLPKGRWDDDLSDLVNRLLLTFVRNLVVSPLAYYLFPFIAPGKTSIEILTEAGVEHDAGHRALQELQTRIMSTVFREDGAVVTLSDTALLKDVLRYDIPQSD
jgi:hypothetical protein